MLHALPVLAALAAAPSPTSLTTVAEQSGFQRTGRLDEVLRLCAGLEQAQPGRARCTTYGTTPEGRPLVALIASADGVLDPEKARLRKRTVMFWQGGIHAGEIDGKDAGFMVLRDALAGKTAAAALGRVTVVFVPIVNVDGHERFGPNQRPNQDGPVETGWRVNAQNLNLNRDYTKLDAPETAALLKLMNAWDPLLLADLHVTDGAKFQHDVAVLVEPRLGSAENLRPLGAALREELLRRLTAAGHQPLGFYPQLVKEDDPSSGFAEGITPPRLANGYWPLRNRLAVLVETHSWKDYGTRVHATYDALTALLELAARDGPRWRYEAGVADEADRTLGGKNVVLTSQFTAASEALDFLGYAYTREPSAVSGGVRIRYDARTPQVWHVPFHSRIEPVLQTTAPAGGYVVPPAAAPWMAEKLALHGLSFQRVTTPRSGVAAEAFHVSDASFRPQPYEGRFPVTVQGAWQEERVEVLPGSLYVPVGQRGGRLAVALLDPVSPDSFLAWGFFHAIFEQKEYLETYVAEDAAEALLRDRPDLRQEFQHRLETDAAFAASPEARLRFFHARLPSWDPQWRRYPVLRVAAAP